MLVLNWIDNICFFQLGRHGKERTPHRHRVKSSVYAKDRAEFKGNRKLQATKRTVLVIRIKAKDAVTTASEAQLADDIFGTRGDAFNLRSGYEQCSGGQMLIQPFVDHPLASNGVYTVHLPNTNVSGASDVYLREASLAQAKTDLGTHPYDLADHVMVCIPEGTLGTWIAYAACNHPLSVYNNIWCQYPSAHLHELGELRDSLSCLLVWYNRLIQSS